jgi:hypothetical protein
MVINVPQPIGRHRIHNLGLMGLVLAGGMTGALLADVLSPWLGSRSMPSWPSWSSALWAS